MPIYIIRIYVRIIRTYYLPSWGNFDRVRSLEQFWSYPRSQMIVSTMVQKEIDQSDVSKRPRIMFGFTKGGLLHQVSLCHRLPKLIFFGVQTWAFGDERRGIIWDRQEQDFFFFLGSKVAFDDGPGTLEQTWPVYLFGIRVFLFWIFPLVVHITRQSTDMRARKKNSMQSLAHETGVQESSIEHGYSQLTTCPNICPLY